MLQETFLPKAIKIILTSASSSYLLGLALTANLPEVKQML